MASYKTRFKRWAKTHRFSDFKPGDRVSVVGTMKDWACPVCRTKGGNRVFHRDGIVASCNDIYPEVQVAFRGHSCWIKIMVKDLKLTSEHKFETALKGLAGGV